VELKPGYKQTEAGVIPVDWEVAPLGKHATFKTGPFGSALHQSDYVDGGVPVVNPMQIVDGRILPTSAMSITESAARRLSDFRLSAGNIVIGRRGEMGRCAFVLPEQHGWLCGTGSMIVRTGSSLDARFIQRVLASPPIIAEIENTSVGSTMINLNQSTLANLLVPFPPTKAEQEAIAGALSDMDALIESLEQLIAKKRHLKQGAMQELLNGHKRLPGFQTKPGFKQTEGGRIPEDWQVDNIENLAHITTGARNTQDRIDDGQYPFFVRSQIVERINSYSYDGEAVLTAGDGVGTGKVFHYINGRFDAHQRVYRISEFSERINGYFFYLYFSSHFYRRIMQMTAKSSVDSVRREMIAGMLVPLPPTKAEQEAIASIPNDMDAEISALEAKLAKARQLKQGMMQELLTGRTRLK
jgi:type I restriction enzyme S subunit